jgi:hypothetical protein
MSYDRPPGFIPPFQDLATLSAHISAGESTIENWVKMGLFPAPKKVGGKRLWSWKEVERHLAPDDATMAPSKIDIAASITNATRRAAQGH